MRRRLSVLLVAVAASACAVGAVAQPPTDDPGRPVAVVVRVKTPSLFDSFGRPNETAPPELERITARIASLRRDEFRDVPIALSIAGVACEELRLSDAPEAHELLAEIRRVATTRPVLPAAYADVRVTDVRRKALGDEVDDGHAALRACARADPRGPFVPGDLSIPHADAAEALRAAGVTTALSRFAVPPSEKRPRIVPAVLLEQNGSIDGLESARPEAEGIVVVLDVDARDPASVLVALSTDERFALRDVGELSDVDVFGGVIDTTEPAGSRFYDAVDATRGTHATFRSFTTSTNRLVGIYRTIIGRGRSTAAIAPSEGVRRLGNVRDAIDEQFDLVTVDDATVTFTSSRGSIPVTITNRATYPIRVRVSVRSTKLDFPSGNERVVVVEPPGDTITFDAIARSTGTFPTGVMVSTTDREVVVHSADLSVRSTAANIPAVVLTAGGAIFLMAWAGRRFRRRDTRETIR